MRILIVEDDSSVAQSLELMLKSERFNPYITDLGHEAIELAKIYDYDIILLDLTLPDMSGYDVLRSLRVGKVKTPILILSGFAGIEDKVRGLGVGADDYVTKPFHKDDLIARIHAIVRRTMGHAEPTLPLRRSHREAEAKQAEMRARPCRSPAKNTECWNSWRCARGHTITKEMFLNQLYGGMDEPEQKIIDVFICKLRKKLAEASGGKNYIETVWGRGYALREPDEQRLAG